MKRIIQNIRDAFAPKKKKNSFDTMAEFLMYAEKLNDLGSPKSCKAVLYALQQEIDNYLNGIKR